MHCFLWENVKEKGVMQTWATKLGLFAYDRDDIDLWLV